MTNTRNVMGRTVTITDENIVDAMPATACNYWASVYYVLGEGLHIQEYDEPKDIFVSFGEMRDAFVHCINNTDANGDSLAGYPHDYFVSAITNGLEDGEPGGIDWGCIDTDAMDVWVQRAAFGKLVYG